MLTQLLTMTTTHKFPSLVAEREAAADVTRRAVRHAAHNGKLSIKAKCFFWRLSTARHSLSTALNFCVKMANQRAKCMSANKEVKPISD